MDDVVDSVPGVPLQNQLALVGVRAVVAHPEAGGSGRDRHLDPEREWPAVDLSEIRAQ
nr:hypothetical protein [Nocardia cerradoensis]